MRSLTIAEVLETYQRIMAQSGGLVGIRDFGALESAIVQPYMTFDGNELYPSLVEKAAALGFSLIQNHLLDEQVEIILSLASGNLTRESFSTWLVNHAKSLF